MTTNYFLLFLFLFLSSVSLSLSLTYSYVLHLSPCRPVSHNSDDLPVSDVLRFSTVAVPSHTFIMCLPKFGQMVKKFRAFCGPRGSLPCLKHSATGFYPEPDESNSHVHTLFFNTNFNIILQSSSCLLDCSISFRFCDKMFVCISHLCRVTWQPIITSMIQL
jgi:hypothetical protein